MPRIKYQEAAGLTVKRGRPPAGPSPLKADLVKLYVKEGQSVRAVAAALGRSKDAVHRALRAYEIKARPPAKRSRLMKLDQERLFADLAEKGINRTAEKWGIPRRTFLDYLARIRRKRS
jgi:predicted transcriptional regulator